MSVRQQGATQGSSPHTRPDLPSFPGICTRFLRAKERPYAAQFPYAPVVLEAQLQSSQAFLEEFLRWHEESIVSAIHNHGALLLRGFQARTERDFEAAINSIRSFRPMKGYFMSEPGRTPVRMGSKVFYTNITGRTGGGFKLPGCGFHTENYYSTDVPAFLCFWCKQPPRLGGETAISHLAKAYAQLGPATRERLEAGVPCQVRQWPVEAVARRYSASPGVVQRHLEEFGVQIVDDCGQCCVDLVKPPVVQHPYRACKCLLANLAGALPGFDEAIVERFLTEYSGWIWAVFRQIWKRPRIHQAAEVLVAAQHALASPRVLQHYVCEAWKRWFSESAPQLSCPNATAQGTRLANRMSAEEVHDLADAVWRYSSVFTWKQGDVLILDNIQMAHAGMPGWGARELRAMLCNPIRFPFATESGIAKVQVELDYRSIHDRLCKSDHSDAPH